MLTSKRQALVVSTLWSAFVLLASWVLSTYLGIIREFELGTDFDAHNRLHWFRPVAFFWFHWFSILPSVALTVLIYARHSLHRGRIAARWVLGALTSFVLLVGAYAVWENSAMMHHFSQ